ncbi:myosin 2 [Striga asiatica]|uniref:Ribosome-recycling factor, chloroplastic n=1 Tax=Striga asiatica TaxID=4170 RepID=A0A5A7QBB5_STRAF|nr:myosin 2 [Striga asiatica]
MRAWEESIFDGFLRIGCLKILPWGLTASNSGNGTVSASIAVGSQVWVEDPEVAWTDGEVVEVNGDEIKVFTSSEKINVADLANIHPKDPDAPPCGVDDMTKLAYLHEPGVLYNLRCRYDANEIYALLLFEIYADSGRNLLSLTVLLLYGSFYRNILYTYTGNILIAVNPFQRLPHLYNNQIMEKYKGVALGELGPHPFAIADAAYRQSLQMVNEGISQAILVSGESGAGKTESTKMLMQYFAYMGGRVAAEGRTVEQQVLESNPVLEAFGNAKTVRNNNSRDVEDVEKYKLGNPRTFHYLNQSNCYELDGVDECKEYLSTRRAMDVVGISSDEQDAIFRVVAAILHLGNIEFAKVSESDASQPKDDQSRFHLKTAADLLMCDEKSLEDSLCKRVMITRDETITRNLDPSAAALSRDALAKIVYSRLFDWLVNKINHSIGQDPDSKFLIGVLDIYGFESFKTNSYLGLQQIRSFSLMISFEQFCINLTNEKLQQHFNQHVFKMEQEEYTKEEIDWSYIEFVDNQDILDLIEKKPGGIIALLDEACMFPRSTNETFAEKLYQTFKDHKRFLKPKLSRTDFTICHYAGDVTYQTELFLDKNKDYVVAEHQALLSTSNCVFVSGLFPPLPEESSKTSKFSSIGSQFKQQLQSLLETLSATEPHYIRCVKPNNLLKPAIFENSNVLQQLCCGGVMEAIRISCAGFPTRKTFDEFISRFKILEPNALNGSSDEVAACQRILGNVGLQGYQIGKTKVFLRAGQMAELDAHRGQVLGRSACIIQKKVRSHLARKYFILLRMSAVQIQAMSRGQVARHIYDHKRRTAAASKIQNESRAFLARKAYALLSSSAILIQAGLRGMAACNELQLRKKTKAAIVIQRHFRGHWAYSWYLRMKRAAVVAQCACRARKAHREFRLLKLAAKETGALQEAKSKLEKQVEELTWQLELEKRMRADIQEAKNQETSKLQSAMEKMQLEFQETKEQLMNELEAAKKGGGQVSVVQVPEGDGQVPIVQEVSVIDHDLIDKLTAENEKLKLLIDGALKIVFQSLVSSLEKKIDETEKKYEKTNKLSEDRLKQALESESKIIQLKTAMQRLEEKLSDIETEDQILRKQALLNAPSRKVSGRFGQIPQPVENGGPESLRAASLRRYGSVSYDNLRRSHVERHRGWHSIQPKRPTGYQCNQGLMENVDSLLTCIGQLLGFSEGKPVAAFTIYKCLVHWRSFEAERTSIFDRLIQIIGSAIEDEANNDYMAYWLSNTSTLLFLLQHTLKAGASSASKPPQPTSFFGRMAQGFRSSPSSNNLPVAGLDGIQQVEAKYPALLFKQQLTAYVEKIYGIIRDNSKKELSSLLSSFIQAPKTLSTSSPHSSYGSSEEGSPSGSVTGHWESIIESLNRLLTTLKNNFVCIPDYIVVLNSSCSLSLLLHKECCTFNNGEYIKAGLDKLEVWCGHAQECVGLSWDELKHVRQAVGLLVIHQKTRITYDDLTTDLCPMLSVQQLYRICTLYCDDNFNTPSVAPEVISSMKVLMTEESNDTDSSSYLLDDDPCIPFSVDDISSSLRQLDFTNVKPAVELLENPDFDNKDEAVRCINIVKEAIAASNKQKALKFLGIVRRLNQNLPIDDLLSTCKNVDPSSSSSNPSNGVKKSVQDEKDEEASVNGDMFLNGERSYTEEHVHMVRQIWTKKDYYSILGLEKNCTVEEEEEEEDEESEEVEEEEDDVEDEEGGDIAARIKTTCHSLMNAAIDSLSRELTKLRTGRASSGMIDHIVVEQYGVKTPISRMAVVSVLDPKTLAVTPYDPNALKELEKAIISSPLGLNPKTDNQRLIVPIPPLTKEHMQAVCKVVAKSSEDVKQSIRRARQKALDSIKKAAPPKKKEKEKDKDKKDKKEKAGPTIFEDDAKRLEKEIDDLTKKFIKTAEDMCKAKEKEIRGG